MSRHATGNLEVEHLDSMLKRIAEDDREIDEETRRVNARRERTLRAEAGGAYDRLISSRDECLRSLNERDDAARTVALSLLTQHWQPDAITEAVTEPLTFSGPRKVQVRAISCLAFIKNRLYGTKVSSILAEYALNPQIDVLIRRDVYTLLRCSFGTFDERLNAIHALKRDPTCNNAIDPEIIQKSIAAEEEPLALNLPEARLVSIKLQQEGKRLLAEGRYAEAEQTLSSAVSAWPAAPGPLLARARAREALGLFEKAVEDCSAAISLGPSIANFYRRRGGLYERMGRQDLAIADFDRADSLEGIN